MNAVQAKETALDIDNDDECSIYAQGRDPVTGDPLFNAKALAAIAEGEAMMRGEIPGRWYKPHEFDPKNR